MPINLAQYGGAEGNPAIVAVFMDENDQTLYAKMKRKSIKEKNNYGFKVRDHLYVCYSRLTEKPG